MSVDIATERQSLAAVAGLFDRRYYEMQACRRFESDEEALDHYLVAGAPEGLDPSPYFDTRFYYDQGFAVDGGNALLHYVEYAPSNRSYRPNPLFGNGYYLAVATDARTGVAPLLHYLERGCYAGFPASQVHATLLQAAATPDAGHLRRGCERSARALFVTDGTWPTELLISAVRQLQGREMSATVVAFPGANAPEDLADKSLLLALERYGEECVFERPSAIRLLIKSLVVHRPLFAITDTYEVLAPLREEAVPTYLLAPEFEPGESWPDLDRLCEDARRVVIPSSEWLYAGTAASSTFPPNVALRSYHPSAVAEVDAPAEAARFAASILELAFRDLGRTSDPQPGASRSGRPPRKILVPCTDWAVSGVNTALEAVGEELIRRGWDLEIVFTRDRSLVEESLGPTCRLPELPYRWLPRRRPGIDGMWESLIAEIQADPCIVFTGYDFYGNSVVPALTDDVGVVMWVQADDGDYYEQTYRLGPYCNAIVCVSSQIRDQVNALHPGLDARVHVIHNTSIRESDVLPHQSRSSERLRIVYTGRLVQYQKRILDFIPLADALEALGLDFTIDLIGTAPAHDEAATLLPQRAARHLDAGRMRMLGRLSRSDVLDQLRDSHLFILLSEFEGLPLSLVEAMASGCVPVVAEMNSGISEVLVSGENGLVIQGRDWLTWADTIRDLWQDQARLARMAAHAEQTVRESFTVELIAEQFDALFNAVAEEVAHGYTRPPALTWGPNRALFGDVLPPPTMYRLFPVAGLG